MHERSAAMNFMLGCCHQVNERRIVFFFFISMVNLCRASLLDEYVLSLLMFTVLAYSSLCKQFENHAIIIEVDEMFSVF